ncbi:MAG: biotin--[acetyl-CoA-carboxylase] ligase [Campylobacterales bacterium]
METRWLDRVDSTQLYLSGALKNGELTPPIAVATLDQTGGIGSRANRWMGRPGNLAFSFALAQSDLPGDLPLQSASIYFGFLLREALGQMGSGAWMKWPNDLYLGQKKIGGVMTQLFGRRLLCGIGLNLKSPAPEYGEVEIAIDAEALLKLYFKRLEAGESWGRIFSRFGVEFERSRDYFVHVNGQRASLKEAILDRDGSVLIGSERVFSER